MLTSLRAVGELQNPAIRERHWEQLMSSTKVYFLFNFLFAIQHSRTKLSFLTFFFKNISLNIKFKSKLHFPLLLIINPFLIEIIQDMLYFF